MDISNGHSHCGGCGCNNGSSGCCGTSNKSNTNNSSYKSSPYYDGGEVGWHEVVFDNDCHLKEEHNGDEEVKYVVCSECDKFEKCNLIDEFFEKYSHMKHNLNKVRDNNDMIKKVDLNKDNDFTFSSYVVAGDYIYTSHIGAVTDDEGNKLTTIEEQTEQSLKKLEDILQREGADLDDVVNTTVYLRHLQYFQGMREVYREYFTDGYPARMTATTDFIEDDCLVMIVAVAYKPE